MKKALTIAGSDTSGGAGIQADLSTFQELGVYGMTALTTIVTMDPKNGWSHNVFPQPMELVETQLETILDGVGVDAMKTGMLGSSEMIEMAARTIDEKGIKNVVVDPVMVCKGADEPLHPEHTVSYREALVPKATVVTPNLFEASQLSGVNPIETLDDMKQAAARIKELGADYVLVKGGGSIGETAVDVLYDGEDFEILESEKIDTDYTHGAGCTYSSAICAGLATGKDVRTAVRDAKVFISKAIEGSFALNEYIGPVKRYANREQ
ncbi:MULTISPECIES: pyridoxine/pyridoxal/pyridoxamine kinase [Alteribacter]|uniref:pyridoxal kinase n=1 Tax=Alteribacter keqinensis TaxID=2483800 RepID=A0A3M7TQQ0_9BACI|nr:MULTISPECIES: pyridoxine/pyridoxal/pyridoxamine kinase [Alteribacter]MBM7095501.1 pyridoxine/pyridoxal/pyridoxamine kinase [Alteribacter salitolerans]RNA67898.1 bifunctional hydroxymethylpyrimidine kinase/phosphomethylpyrimidine kinase [Alteribacter keqinensis]